MATVPNPQPDLGSLLDIGVKLRDRYRLTKIIGFGGMGAVYLARDEKSGDKVAVKVLLPSMTTDEEARGRFEREARILRKLKNPRICRVLDVGDHEGFPYMVMEYLRGRDLAQHMDDTPKFEVERAIEVTVQLCEAIAEAHARGIVHRDLKPENVFLLDAKKGVSVKLLDFGLSKDRSSVSMGVGGGKGEGKSGGRTRKLTGTQQVFGTPYYMGPEQWVASGKVGPSADQWAIGAILFEMLAGRPPFHADAFAAVCTSILHDSTPSIRKLRSDLPAAIDSVLMRALEKDPRHRFRHVADMAAGLAECGDIEKSRIEHLQSLFEQSIVDEETFPELPPTSKRPRSQRDPLDSSDGEEEDDDFDERGTTLRAAVALAAGVVIAGVAGAAISSAQTDARHAAKTGLVPKVELSVDAKAGQEPAPAEDTQPTKTNDGSD